MAGPEEAVVVGVEEGEILVAGNSVVAVEAGGTLAVGAGVEAVVVVEVVREEEEEVEGNVGEEDSHGGDFVDELRRLVKTFELRKLLLIKNVISLADKFTESCLLKFCVRLYNLVYFSCFRFLFSLKRKSKMIVDDKKMAIYS